MLSYQGDHLKWKREMKKPVEEDKPGLLTGLAWMLNAPIM